MRNKLFFFIWVILSAAAAALLVNFYKAEILGIAVPFLAAGDMDIAMADNVVAIKSAIFIFLLLVLPFVNMKIFGRKDYAAKQKAVYSAVCFLTVVLFYIAAAVCLQAEPVISSALIRLDGQIGNVYAVFNYHMNVVLAIPLAIQLFGLALLFNLQASKIKSDFQVARRNAIFALITSIIALGFHIPLFILTLIYLPVYIAFMLGYFAALQINVLQEKIAEKRRNAEHKIVQHAVRGKIKVLSAAAAEREVAVNAETTFADLLDSDTKENVKYMLFGGECGIIIDRLRFAQRVSTLQVSESTVRLYTNSDCPIKTVAELYDALYKNHGEIGVLKNLKSIFMDLASGKSKMSFKELQAYIIQESRNADTQSRKLILQPAESLLHCYAEEVEDHCDFAKCSVNSCFSSNEAADGIDWHSVVSMLRLARIEEALQIGRMNSPLFLSSCYIENTNEAAEVVKLLNKLGKPTAKTKYKNLPQITENAKKIAVIGGGIAGINAAFMLRKKGYKVVIFEKNDVLGGSLKLYPDCILPQEAMFSDIESFLDIGIEVRYNSELGKTFSIGDIEAEFDMILLAIGAEKTKISNVIGIENAVPAAEFLLNKNFDAVQGKVIAIIGNNANAVLCSRVCGKSQPQKIYVLCKEDFAHSFAAVPESCEVISSSQVKEIIKKEQTFDIVLQDETLLEVDLVIYSCNHYVDTVLLAQNGIAVGGKTAKFDRHSFRTEKNNVFVCGACTDLNISLQDTVQTVKAAVESMISDLN
ncbi:MAG: FAD-dependent oxidoreductase [Firmicutes bacterium]|nr:FAD-dependent oxidoreductase [Bacillota bacterium]